uniref:Uncharacterized protein n=1 Tax=Rhizophora mucronata TaxID=61149 RepID=A0A2P2NNT1_RHIMU
MYYSQFCSLFFSVTLLLSFADFCGSTFTMKKLTVVNLLFSFFFFLKKKQETLFSSLLI